MKRESLSASIGLGALTLVFAFSVIQVLSRPDASAPASDGRIVLRFAHWQLESGLRDALDELSREYEKLHPHIRLEQVPVPSRTYAQWIKTRLIGDTATDIIQLPRNIDDETLARHFRPLTAEVEQPNPYNRDTPLAALPWRETFIDGMAGNFSYRPTLLEYYGIPLSMFTVRIYYNRDLWRALLGDTPPPADYDSFLALCAEVRAASARAGRQAIPLAGSADNAPILVSRFVAAQTQRLSGEITPSRTLRATAADIGLGYLDGSWKSTTPAFVNALAIAREVALLMQPGYEQLRHEDATFYFTQGRALMVTSGSWDSPVFRQLCSFELGVFEVPLPDQAHARYGRNSLGPASEADASTGMAFSVTRQTPHAAEALDFLRFLTSRSGNAAFSRRSGWLPSVAGVEPPAELQPFQPRIEGRVAGFDLTLGSLGASSGLVMGRNQNLLINASGSVEKFQRALDAELLPAIREDLARVSRMSLLNLARQDVLLGGRLALARETPGDAELAARVGELAESQNQQESLRAWIDLKLATTAR